MATLFRRREVWVPTLSGWLLALAIAAALLAVLGLGAADFLMLHEPALGRDGRGARTMVVEGWLDEADLDQAIAAIRGGHYERVLTTGGPIESWNDARVWKSFAERAAGYLKAQGLSAIPVIAVPAPASAQDRTFLSAVMVRVWAQRAGVTLTALDLYSADVHARRSRLLFRMAFGPTVEVGVLASAPRDHDAQRWWSSSAGAKAVVGEALSLAWTKCCFWPAAPGTHEERWAAPEAAP